MQTFCCFLGFSHWYASSEAANGGAIGIAGRQGERGNKEKMTGFMWAWSMGVIRMMLHSQDVVGPSIPALHQALEAHV